MSLLLSSWLNKKCQCLFRSHWLLLEGIGSFEEIRNPLCLNNVLQKLHQSWKGIKTQRSAWCTALQQINSHVLSAGWVHQMTDVERFQAYYAWEMKSDLSKNFISIPDAVNNELLVIYCRSLKKICAELFWLHNCMQFLKWINIPSITKMSLAEAKKALKFLWNVI